VRKRIFCAVLPLLLFMPPAVGNAEEATSSKSDAKAPEEQDFPAFDAEKIAEMLEQAQSDPNAVQYKWNWERYEQLEIPDTVKRDIRRRRYPRLSASETDSFRARVGSCWSPPVGATNAAELAVTIRLRLFPDGSFAGAEPLRDNKGTLSREQQAAFDAALRAVQRCAPYRLPVAKYATWREIEMSFEPSHMLGR